MSDAPPSKRICLIGPDIPGEENSSASSDHSSEENSSASSDHSDEEVNEVIERPCHFQFVEDHSHKTMYEYMKKRLDREIRNGEREGCLSLEDILEEMKKQKEMETVEPKVFTLKRMLQLNIFKKLFGIIYNRMPVQERREFPWIQPQITRFMGDIQFARLCGHYSNVLEDFPKSCIGLPQFNDEESTFVFEGSKKLDLKTSE